MDEGDGLEVGGGQCGSKETLAEGLLLRRNVQGPDRPLVLNPIA